jgi:hypothetical protein
MFVLKTKKGGRKREGRTVGRDEEVTDNDDGDDNVRSPCTQNEQVGAVRGKKA